MKTIINNVLIELQKAEEKHPNWPDDLLEQGCVLTEELTEAVRAINQYRRGWGDVNELKTELYQTAAMCFRILKNLEK